METGTSDDAIVNSTNMDTNTVDERKKSVIHDVGNEDCEVISVNFKRKRKLMGGGSFEEEAKRTKLESGDCSQVDEGTRDSTVFDCKPKTAKSICFLPDNTPRDVIKCELKTDIIHLNYDYVLDEYKSDIASICSFKSEPVSSESNKSGEFEYFLGTVKSEPTASLKCSSNVVTPEAKFVCALKSDLIAHVDTPEFVAPAVNSPDLIAPAVDSPDIIAPAVDSPDIIAPAVDSPGVIAPAVDSPGVIAPAADSPDVAPAVDSPDIIAPAVDSPDFIAPVNITPTFTCYLCKVTFADELDLLDHHAMHYMCKNCGQLFKRQSYLTKHKNSQHNRNANHCYCNFCGKEFRILAHRNTHEKFCPPLGLIHVCRFCTHTCKVQIRMEDHLKTDHKLISIDSLDQCISRVPVDEIQETVSRTSSIETPIPKDLEAHNSFILSHQLHLNSPQNYYYGDLYTCDICDQGFQQKGNLVKHRTTHSEGKLQACLICELKFEDIEDLKRHMVTERGPEKYFLPEELYRHIKIYTGHEWPMYVCSLCGTKYSYLSTVTKHLQKHGDSYSCSMCGRRN